MRKIYKLSAALLLCAFLCSCFSKASAPESVSAALESASAAPASGETPIELRLVTSEDGVYGLPGAASESGYYNILWNDDGSSNLVYTDFDTARTIYLSGEVSAYPQTEQDPSWFKDGVSYLFVVEDKLYAVYPGALFNATSEARPACIYRMNLDGGNREVLIEFGSGQQLTQSISSDGKSLYAAIQTATPYGQTTNELISVELETGRMETLCALPQGEALVGAFSDKLITKNYISGNDESIRLSTICLNGLERQEIFSLPFNTTSGAFHGDSYYYIDHENSALMRANFATGENTVVCGNIPAGPQNMIYISGIWGNHFVYRLTRFEDEIEKQKLYGIDLATKEIHENGFTYSYQGMDHSVNIIACAQDKYLYVQNCADQSKTIYSEDGTAVQVTDSKFVYALEDVADFWANADNQTLIEDLT